MTRTLTHIDPDAQASRIRAEAQALLTAIEESGLSEPRGYCRSRLRPPVRRTTARRLPAAANDIA